MIVSNKEDRTRLNNKDEQYESDFGVRPGISGFHALLLVCQNPIKFGNDFGQSDF
jgi:hypothetical protein